MAKKFFFFLICNMWFFDALETLLFPNNTHVVLFIDLILRQLSKIFENIYTPWKLIKPISKDALWKYYEQRHLPNFSNPKYFSTKIFCEFKFMHRGIIFVQHIHLQHIQYNFQSKKNYVLTLKTCLLQK